MRWTQGLKELDSRTQGAGLEDSMRWTQGLKELDSRNTGLRKYWYKEQGGVDPLLRDPCRGNSTSASTSNFTQSFLIRGRVSPGDTRPR